MRTDGCTSRVIAGRLAKAEEFLENAELLADDEQRRNAASSLFVNAGIAAADVVCCKRLGVHAKGPDHNDAVVLLEKVDAELAKHLRRLLVNRSRVTYSAQGLPVSEFTKIQRSAIQLVAAARHA